MTDDAFLIFGLLLITVVLIVVVFFCDLCSRAFICLVPLADGFLSLPLKIFIHKVFLLQLLSTFERTNLILVMNLFIYFIPITLHMPKVVNAISRRVPVLQNFSFSLPFCVVILSPRHVLHQ